MSAQLEPRRFNVTEYYRMAEAGIIKPHDRVELIDGEIINLSPIGSSHAACVSRLDRLFQGLRQLKVVVTVQNPVRLNQFSEPVPDLAILRFRKNFYSARHPKPEDVLLIIEVADTTLLKDRIVKVLLYAAARVPECWLVNVVDDQVVVYSDPRGKKYRTCNEYGRGQQIISAAFPRLSVKVDDILGQRSR